MLDLLTGGEYILISFKFLSKLNQSNMLDKRNRRDFSAGKQPQYKLDQVLILLYSPSSSSNSSYGGK